MRLPRAGDWTLREPLGRGGMGEVWVGVDERTGRRAAVKVLSRSATDERALRDFSHEVRAIAALDHPNVVRIFDQGRLRDAGAMRAGTPWLAMELADRSLGQRVQGWAFLQHVLGSILDGLAHVHARGWIHRDLKPSNVLVAGFGPTARVLLADFGLGHLVADATVTTTAGSGTPRYMSPEQHLGRWSEFGPWTDLYALGAITWFLACGRHVFAAVDPVALRAEHLHAALPPFAPAFPVPSGLEDWLVRLLAKRPRDRHASAADAAHALRRLGGPGGDAAAPPARLEVPATWEDPPTHPVPPALGIFAARTPGLVGRTAERVLLWDALRDVSAHGRPRAVILEGTSGIGKTHLAVRAGERAVEVGAAACVTAFHDARGGPGTGLVAAVARAVGCTGSSRAEAAGSARAWAYEWSREGDADADARHLADLVAGDAVDARVRYATLVAWLRRLAADRALVVLLDDAHHSAEACVLALRLLDESLPILIMATVAPEALAARPVVSAIVDRLRAHPAATNVRLGPLDDARIVALVRDRIGLGPALAARIALRSAGNPRLAVELVRSCVERGVLTNELPVDLAAAWRATAERVVAERTAAEVLALRAAAALGPEVDGTTWAQVCAELGVPAPVELCDGLCERGLAVVAGGPRTGWSLVHGLLAEALLEGPDAGRIHLACAAVLGRTAGTEASERRAAHLLAAGRGEEALGELVEAAARRWRAGDLAVVEGLLDTWRRTAEDLPLAPEDPRWAPGWLILAGLARVQRRLEEARGWATTARDAAERHAWPSVAVNAVAELATIARTEGRADLARDHLRIALAAAEAQGDLGRAAMVKTDLAELLAEHGRPSEAMALHRENAAFHLASGDPWSEARARYGMAFTAVELGALDEAEAHLQACIEGLGPIGATYGIRMATALLARIADLRGDLATAERLHGEVAEAVSLPGEDPTARVRWTVVRLRTGTADTAAASVLIEHGIPEAACTCTHAWALACVAGLQRWDLWSPRYELLVARVDGGGALWSELPHAVTVAGDLAARGHDPLRARMAYALADRWWTRLGRPRP